MSKRIDPLEETLRKFPHLRKHHPAKPDTEPEQHTHGLQVCPECGSKSLRLDGGCMSCLSCGWSACHNS